jgi:hypothetical protein
MSAQRPRLKIGKVLQRIAGFAPTTIIGWKATPVDRNAVRAFLAFLEDRRVLFNPFHLEVEYQVKQSIFDIRTECTQAIGRLSDNSPAIAPIKGIRAACRRFLDEPLVTGRHFHQRDFRWPESPEFFTALGDFRATVGALVANLAVLYKLNLAQELASIIPAEDAGE